MPRGSFVPKMEWHECGDGTYVSETLTHPIVTDDDERQVPFVITIECLNWPEVVGENDLNLPEKSYFKRHGAVWISCLHLIPELPRDKIKNFGFGESDVRFPWYAPDAARYGYGCPVMPVPSSPGDSVWCSKMCPDERTSARIAMRYAEQEVIPHLEDVLAQPVNRIGELAERGFFEAMRPGR